MNNKNKPTRCEANFVCKASASLNEEVQKEMNEPDKSLSGLLEKEKDENKDTEK